jgi:sugar/nucleoside kinase (ribokinase family)
MTYDLAVVGAPFLDLTFVGLPRTPEPGDEVVARELRTAPGGTGMQAIAAARLGLTAALVAPAGLDPGAGALRSMFAAEGVAWIGRESGATSTTAILSTPDGVAMATALGEEEPTAEDVAGIDARAVVLSLGRLPLRPPGAAAYVTTGAIELDAGVRPDAARLGGVRALIVNEPEATRLTGAADALDAARQLSELVPCVVVTLGGDGALAIEDGATVRAAAPSIDVVDATGAGDLFVAAYIWADLAGADGEGRLAWASLYAGLSVRAATAFDGALRRDDLLAEGERRRLPAPRSDLSRP